MSLRLAGTPTRWTLLSIALLISFWVWHAPFHSPPPRPTGYIPAKLYEPEAKACNDHAAAELEDVMLNPRAPLFPVFKDSAKTLPSDLYDPYPEYNSPAWRSKWRGSHAPCLGPRDQDVNGHPDDMPMVHRLQKKVNDPMFGSYIETGLQSDFCFDRHARYDPYGYDENDLEGLPIPQASRSSPVIWDKVNWGLLQGDCFLRNQDRYQPAPMSNRSSTTFWLPSQQDFDEVNKTIVFTDDGASGGVSYRLWKSARNYKQRTAIVIHPWDGNEWSVDTMQHLRSMIMELSLHSGAEYEVIIMVEIKDAVIPIFEDPAKYREALLKSVPAEFGNITMLFNRQLLEKWYPKVGQHGTKTSQPGHMTQTLQLLSLVRPDLEHFWLIDLDVRYTGHHYHHLETMSTWAKEQPRKFLWERASRYYIKDVHGPWANFSSLIANHTIVGFEKPGEEGGSWGIWGPQLTQGIVPIGPEPPTNSPEEDDFQWGVSEEADMINLAPVFDTTGTTFVAKESVDHYPTGTQTPRRATGTTSMMRVSKRLLRAMHHGQITLGASMAPEMYPASTALHHGLKLVVFPTPVFLDFAKSPQAINQAFNQDEGKTVLNLPPLHDGTWHRMSYWASIDDKTTYPDELYKRWLGYSGDSTERLCLPGMLLHPVKGV